MRPALTALLAIAIAAAGCGGSGGNGATAPSGPATAPPTAAPAAHGKTTLTIAIPRSATSSSVRAPRYVSPATSVFAFYDGATLVYAADFDSTVPTQLDTIYSYDGPTTVSPDGACTIADSENPTYVCTLDVTAAVGTHTFGIVTYPNQSAGTPRPSAATRRALQSEPPVFSGVILSEGQLALSVASGTNPAQTMTLLGVATYATIAPPTQAPLGEPATVAYTVYDSANKPIILPGNYDNGPVTITASPAPLVSMQPVSDSAPPSMGARSFMVTCATTTGGTVTFTASVHAGPNTLYASGLIYAPSNYPGTVIGTATMQCIGAT